MLDFIQKSEKDSPEINSAGLWSIALDYEEMRLATMPCTTPFAKSLTECATLHSELEELRNNFKDLYNGVIYTRNLLFRPLSQPQKAHSMQSIYARSTRINGAADGFEDCHYPVMDSIYPAPKEELLIWVFSTWLAGDAYASRFGAFHWSGQGSMRNLEERNTSRANSERMRKMNARRR